VTDAQRVYNVLFPGTIPADLESRFASAWHVLAADYNAKEREEFDRVVASEGDLEAIEFVARRRKQLPMLVAQVRLMCVLAETRPDHARYYVRTGDHPWMGLLSLAWAGLQGVVKYLKGVYLLQRMHT
jgi:hypothetical protein